jgi:hypothetical protein
MKKFTWLLAAALPVVLFFSCQKEVSKDSPANRNPTPAFAYLDNSCSNSCIQQSGPYYEKSTTMSYTANPFGSVTVVVYNTWTDLVYKFTSTTHDIRKVTIGGIDFYASNIAVAEPFTVSIPIGVFGTDWSACDNKNAQIEVRRVNSNGTGGGQYVTTTTNYNLVPPCAAPPPPVCDLTGYQTITQGYYMASPVGEAFVTDNGFTATIGCGTNTTSYTSAEIIALTPGDASGPGVFAKQIITLTVNLQADAIWGHQLDCLKVVGGTFDGWTVAEVLAEANAVYGGCSSAHTVDEMNTIVTAINENFDNGIANNGNLTCGLCE